VPTNTATIRNYLPGQHLNIWSDYDSAKNLKSDFLAVLHQTSLCEFHSADNNYFIIVCLCTLTEQPLFYFTKLTVNSEAAKQSNVQVFKVDTLTSWWRLRLSTITHNSITNLISSPESQTVIFSRSVISANEFLPLTHLWQWSQGDLSCLYHTITYTQHLVTLAFVKQNFKIKG